ncbi:helix-turn-helix transcriptional regulator [Enterobacteriaceae bacterium YMB-R22]|jgi:DNA-binding NarL/FixJ family response regulator|uniref:helix-turn-helix domain-containing protein n=1 Tax=Tenebrionicola larvae TaxID=2815733 RepID=UPI002011CC0C|nr:LuxR C-terminal-related transcriptional regulator [Tenebrionicola larvae]MBV4412397.1 helix-turn-helix transcriptional regulator [Tenebrionicola larvae]
MTQGRHQKTIVYSRYPAMAAGLQQCIKDDNPHCMILPVCGYESLTPLLLLQASLAIIDLTGEANEVEQDLQQLQPLYRCAPHIHWIFLVPAYARFTAVQQLLWPNSTLLPNSAGLRQIQQCTRMDAGGLSYLDGDIGEAAAGVSEATLVLTLSERQVLRLMAKGWSINQISALLKKSNKTVSAQKNSAMRRLALRSNAEMYAWINSPRGMKELNLQSTPSSITEDVV